MTETLADRIRNRRDEWVLSNIHREKRREHIISAAKSAVPKVAGAIAVSTVVLGLGLGTLAGGYYAIEYLDDVLRERYAEMAPTVSSLEQSVQASPTFVDLFSGNPTPTPYETEPAGIPPTPTETPTLSPTKTPSYQPTDSPTPMPTDTPQPTYPLRVHVLTSVGSGVLGQVTYSDGEAPIDDAYLWANDLYDIQRIRPEEQPSGCDISRYNAEVIWFSSSVPSDITVNGQVIGHVDQTTHAHGYIFSYPLKIDDEICMSTVGRGGYHFIFGETEDVYYHYDSYCTRGGC